MINELQSTNEIENVKSTKKEIAVSLNKTKGENKRFDGLVNQYIMLENGNVSFNSISDIRKIFDSIVSSEIKETDLPDGNGRVGRYILAKLLNDNLDSFTALTFSYVVNNNKNKYYKSFEEASDYFNKGELTNFIDEMMQLLIEGQNNIIETFENNIKIITRLAKSLDQQTLNKYDLAVLFVLLQDKVFGSKYSRISIKELKDIVGYSRNKVNEVISKYEDKLVKIKSNTVVFEAKDSYVEELLSIDLK
ncbi:hypothetical protein [Staphylococcus croceilyticus]|uniref:hypothetical protein n=1 Tax=Staphylococcus croceilyticus TaxID=319942 RepID=UPI001E44E9BB|nr:hypothetical protein [Staphylococcus croceilyticus]